MMKRVVLTGATGFVGANLARRLLREGHELHLLVRPGYTPWRIEEILPDVRLHWVDLTDRPALDTVIDTARPDWIFHLAAHGAYSWQNDTAQIIQTNIMGTINLVEACLRSGFEAFVNTGSSSEYGWKNHAPAEDEALDPNSYYAVGKASATLYCRYTAQSRQVHLPTLRLYSVYGPYEEPRRLIPSLILKGLQGELPPLTNPATARDYVYSEDVNDAYLLAATTPPVEYGAIYNVGTGVQTSLAQVVEVARREMCIAAKPAWGSLRPRDWDTDVWVADSRKIQRELGWQPAYSFETGLRAAIEWFRNRPPCYPTP